MMLFRAVLTGASIGLVLVTTASSAPAAPAKPNVIIVLIDDQGYGDLSCHGNPILKTPQMDRLHQQSIRFTDFHVAPMCTPTRSQLMSGRDALPIAKAKLRVGAFEQACDVKPGDASVSFIVPLKKGQLKAQTWFYDAAGNELCGAYYVYVRRK